MICNESMKADLCTQLTVYIVISYSLIFSAER